MIGAERNVPRSTIEAIRDDRSEGIPPEDLQIVDFTRQLLRKNRVDEPLARMVLARLGADQYVQLTTCIGYYAMLAMTVNAVEHHYADRPACITGRPLGFWWDSD